MTFTSSDSQVDLPADYTFTSAIGGDIGTHTFSAALKTAGSQSITATDTPAGTVTGTQSGITVNPAAASTLSVSGFPSPVTAGVPESFTVTALDPYGNVATGYDGTLSFSSSDNQATFPTASTLTAGTGSFTATLETAGTQSISASDGSLTGSQSGITVNARADTTTALSSAAKSTVYGQSVTFTATVNATSAGIGTPTGSVTFYDDATTLGSAPLSGGIATFATTVLTAGADSITAVYNGDTNFVGSTSPVLSQTIEQDGTAATVIASAGPSVFGQSVTFTATVSPAAPGGGTPTGTVIFEDGSTVLGSLTLNGGVATLASSGLSVANHKITAIYGGDGNFTGSQSKTLTQTVTKDATTTTASSSATPSDFGRSVTFTATVIAAAPGGGTPTGTVTFKDGSTRLGKGTLSDGTASITTSSLAVATHSITVSYGGDGDFTTSASASLSQVVNQDGTTTSLISATDPSVYGQSVTFTAAVSATAPGSGTPTGRVTFFDGSTSLGSASLKSGSASFTARALPTGTDSITASYGGSGNFTTSTSAAVVQTVNQAGTTTAVSSRTNPSVFGQSVTLTATVGALAPGSGTPTGTVTFLDGTDILGTVTESGGKATLKTTAMAAGSHTITVSYSGDGNFVASTSGSLIQTINQASTATKVKSSDRSAVFGESLTFTATVSAVSPGSGTPTGSVTFYNGSTSLGTATLSGGTGTFSISTLPVGTDAITAVYGGDSNFVNSTSSILNQAVKQTSTTSAVTSSLNPSTSGQAVTLTATITAKSPGSGRPRAPSPSRTVRRCSGPSLSATAQPASRHRHSRSAATRSRSSTAATRTSRRASRRC